MSNPLRRASDWCKAEETSTLVDYKLMHEAKLRELIKLRYAGD